MPRPTFAQVNLGALRANYHAIVGHVARRADRSAGPGLIAVVKANAYGHGAARIGLALETAGATMLACADIEEGVQLRAAGVRIPILVFGALSVSHLDDLFEAHLTPTISSPAAARAVAAAAAQRECRVSCHLKIDTGMNRLGFRHDNLSRTLPEILSSRHLAIDAVCTHFATADDPDHALFQLQRERFDGACAELRELGLPGCARHAANSAALLRDERVWYDFVRPGLLLYGIVPPPLMTTLSLNPVMSLRSRVVAVKGVRGGEAVGYGASFVPDTARSIAIIPAGYADGLDVRLSGRGIALVRGRRVPIVGSVCMDLMTIDVTGLDVTPGDEVVILGAQGDEKLDVRETAAAIGTIPYELVCRVGSRIERIYDEGAGSVD